MEGGGKHSLSLDLSFPLDSVRSFKLCTALIWEGDAINNFKHHQMKIIPQFTSF